MAAVAAIVVACTACLEADVEVCASGLVCPAGSRCDDANDRCISDEQISVCDGLVEGATCTFGGASGICEDGACVADRCGDGRITGAEDCEPGPPALLGGATCMTLGYYESPGLACQPSCKFDETACVGTCGDGVANGGEACDGDDFLDDADCTDLGYYEGAGLACNPASCTLDDAACMRRCGDDIVDVSFGESCDGNRPAGTCVEFGFDGGPLGCSGFCTPGFDDCLRLGWESESLSLNVLYGVWAEDLDDVFAVGAAGTLLHREGGVWSPELPVITSYRGVWGSSANDVWAVGGSTILHRDGDVSTWTEVAPPVSSPNLHGIWAAAPTTSGPSAPRSSTTTARRGPRPPRPPVRC